MTTLARGISATSTILDVSDESLNVARPFLATLDSETVRVRGLEYVSGAATRWNVDRGIDSTPATHAGGATVTLGDAAGPGGAAEAGTVVVTPPLEVDVAAALEGANAPDGSNPYMTASAIDLGAVLTAGNDAGSQKITGLADPEDDQDAATKAYADTAGGLLVTSDVDPGAVGAGHIWINIAGGPGDSHARWSRRNAANDDWDPYFLDVAADGTLTLATNPDGDPVTSVTLAGDGSSVVLASALGAVTIAADGAVTVAQDGTPIVAIAADGSVDIGGIVAVDPTAFTATINGTIIDGSGNITFASIATADPGGGVVWSNNGVLTIGAGV